MKHVKKFFVLVHFLLDQFQSKKELKHRHNTDFHGFLFKTFKENPENVPKMARGFLTIKKMYSAKEKKS